ncbi:MAG: hypothetical protein IPP19_07115 [Verrucomicrobia bacterium]|nr:hypothetical protein [Verrucomicrobiota bacterium]
MSSAFRISLVTNIVLLGIVAALLWRDRPAAQIPIAPSARTAHARSAPSKTDAFTKELQPNSAGQKLTPIAIAQLEQAGIPRESLVNVLLEDLNRRTTKRVLELQKKYAPKLVPDREMRELSRESDAEQIRELKHAFGEEGYLAWDKEQTLRALNRARVPGDELPMTDDEAEQAYRLQKEFDQKNQDLQMAMEDGVADTADAGTLQAQAQQSLDHELEKLLGKQRFDELRGNTDPTTEVYRTFGDMNPSPGQAKAVVLAEQDYRAREAALAKRLHENPGDAANLTAELKAIRDAQDEKLRQIFGADAYDKMKQQNDPTYKTLKQYAEAWELKDQEIQSVYETIHPFQDQAAQTRSAAEMREAAGQRVNWRDINASIERAQQQAEANLQNLIGSERLRRLKQNGVLTIR